jgi:uncharacterized protein with von Willebrand factor type A (vWA) domain
MDIYDDQPIARDLAHCRVWLDWAVTQINASLDADGIACQTLLAALDGVLCAARGASPAAAPVDASMERKMSEVVIAVQNHDRLMQQLVHVAQSLRSLHEHLGDAANSGSISAWNMLSEKQMRVFSMTEERDLFSRMVGGGGEDAARYAGSGSAGEVDLFEDSAPEPSP